MNRTDAPAKQPKPFGINGQREAILPSTPAGDNTASYDQGFPPITMILKSAGGLPPKGQDMNQILFELSALCRWFSAGAINGFDSAFSTAIGGYPKYSLLISDDGATIFVNIADSNLTNPNTGGSGWVDIRSFISVDRFIQLSNETQVKLGPSGNKQLFINNGAWGAWDADLNAAIPLPVTQGGIGSTTAAGGRTNLGLGNSSTRNVGTTNGTVMAGDDSRVSTLKTAAYKDIGVGAGQVPDMSSFVSNKSINGRMELPGGIILQWGVVQVPGNTTTTFSFGIPFPNAPYIVVGSYQVPASGTLNLTGTSPTQFTAQSSYTTPQYANWFAVGA